MKHFTRENLYEFAAIHERRYIGITRKNVRDSKQMYRQRERAALKRMTAEMVEAELYDGLDADAAYWERELDRAAEDWNDLEAAEVAMRDTGEWSEGCTIAFAAAYREINRRADAALSEWYEAA